MTEYNKLIDDINKGIILPIYLIHGEESFFSDKIIKHITDRIIDESSVDFDFKKMLKEEEEIYQSVIQKLN